MFRKFYLVFRDGPIAGTWLEFSGTADDVRVLLGDMNKYKQVWGYADDGRMYLIA